MRRLRQKKDAKHSPEKNPSVDTNDNSAQTKQILKGAALAATSDSDSNDDTAASQPLFESSPRTFKKPRPTSSWYGTWPRKSNASTKVAKESILAEKTFNKLAIKGTNYLETARPVLGERPPSMNLGKSRETLGITMATTIDSNNTTPSQQKPKIPDKDGAESSEHVVAESSTVPDVPEQPSQKHDTSPVSPPISQGWLGIFLGRSGSQPSLRNNFESSINSSVTISDETNHLQSSEAPEMLQPSDSSKKSDPAREMITQTSVLSSWLGWLSTTPSIATAPPDEVSSTLIENQKDLTNDSPQMTPTPTQFQESTSGYLWGFFLKGSKYPPEAPDIHGATGAVSGSENSTYKSSLSASDKKSKECVDDLSSKEDESKKLHNSSGQKQSSITNQFKQEASLPSENLDKNLTSNLLLPSLRSTFKVYETPSTIEKITRLFNFRQQLDTEHLFLSKEIPKVQKAVVIGIHGLLPAPFIRTVIGQPTGTSIRFANHAAKAIRRWTNIHSTENCDIKIVPLEGGGKIMERVDNLWKLLLTWINHIQNADFILVACHSQGVPVAIMLVAKLIEFGVVSSGRIGVCAMEYKSRLIGGSAGELFEFADPESDVSRKYQKSLQISLDYGVRVVFCGSIDDQLVSMESSTFSTVSHPYIYRAVFVDGRLHAPDFLSHLVGFALKLRNIGISDHGLIRELSTALAGSLYTGEGHSRLYDDGQVYDLAVQFALETTSIKSTPLKFANSKLPATSNPYALPWIMRGLLEEDYVKTKLTYETIELLKMFVDWKPATKVLKDVKYRLEVVKSKL